MDAQNTIPISLSALDTEGPAWLGTLRRAARERFEALGLPTRKVEAWRYTDCRALGQRSFLPASPDSALGFERRHLAPWQLDAAAVSLVFIDGRYQPQLSSGQAPEGLQFASIARLLERAPERLRRVFGTQANDPTAPFVALNTASVDDGMVLWIARGVTLEAPIEVIFVSAEASEPTASHGRLIVVCEPGSHATVVERHVGFGGAPRLSTMVTEAQVGPDAVLRHINVVEEGPSAFHFGTLACAPEAGGRLESHVVSLGGAVVRSAVTVRLGAPRASCDLLGLWAASGRQSLDHYTQIDHVSGHCESHELYKGVVADASVGSFLGRILIHEGAVSSATQQLCKVLLLSEKARVNAKPQLEIDNDDVTATHGAAIGQLSSDALFFLMARGIPEAAARALLVGGFVQELLDRLPASGLAAQLAPRILDNLHELGALGDSIVTGPDLIVPRTDADGGAA